MSLEAPANLFVELAELQDVQQHDITEVGSGPSHHGPSGWPAFAYLPVWIEEVDLTHKVRHEPLVKPNEEAWFNLELNYSGLALAAPSHFGDLVAVQKAHKITEVGINIATIKHT